ncbi:SMP-30/gluconolactonase/LRE family protein [Brevibacterium sp. VCM10]|uniref:SMP-30/gluconolactonase/LRE family protein n=1 Tax=Brevibacterium sp. VCM10 TaxID=1381751 RepID=UPI003FA40728
MDDRTLVVSESYANPMTAFTIESDDSLSNRRTRASFGTPTENTAAFDELDIAPDSTSGIDREGAIWVADFTHRRVLRVHPQRGVLDESSADNGVFATALGGTDGRCSSALPRASTQRSAESRDLPRSSRRTSTRRRPERRSSQDVTRRPLDPGAPSHVENSRCPRLDHLSEAPPIRRRHVH